MSARRIHANDDPGGPREPPIAATVQGARRERRKRFDANDRAVSIARLPGLSEIRQPSLPATCERLAIADEPRHPFEGEQSRLFEPDSP
jgi:hypothetical protein